MTGTTETRPQPPPQASVPHPVRYGVFVLLLVIFTGVGVWLAYQPAQDFVLSSPESVAIGDTFTVTLETTSDRYAVVAVQLAFTYDAALLRLESVEPGLLLPDIIRRAVFGNGHASIALGSGMDAEPGQGSLAVLTFTALVAGDATVALDASSQAATPDARTNVLPDMSPVTVRVR